jgi:penicillin-binding protein 1C
MAQTTRLREFWRRARVWRRAHRRLLWMAGGATIIGLVAVAVWIRFGALPTRLLDLDAQPSLLIVDRHGEPLYEARSGLGSRGDRLEPRNVPPILAAATMAAEDERFRSHVGIDPVAIARAAWRDLRALRILEGGSTITQQTAKLLLARINGGRPAHGWLAKAREAVVALRLEHRLTKDQILALYLTVAPYGNQIEGAARASVAYFGHGLTSLTPAEAAFLAALPQEPGRYNPWRAPLKARPRAVRIIQTMVRRGWLSGADANVARSERVALTREAPSTIAPHFVSHVLAEVADQRATRVETTLDASLQREVVGIIDARRHALDAHHAENVAVAVLDNQTGEWLAWEGSGNYLDSAHGGTIDGVVTPRQPGSALKPFTYAVAFERGYDPASVLADVPSQFPTDEPGVLYSPRNYDGQYRGPLLARAALAGSENVPAVLLASEIGVPAIARMLRRTGFSSLGDNAAHYGLGLTLGNAEVRLDEMVAAYAMFARGGEWMKPTSLRSIDGGTMPIAPRERMVSARTAFWITDILSDNDARAFTFGRGGSLEFPFAVAAKTGTSTAYHDNWAAGYTREVTVGVWVGNFDRTPLRDSSGVTGAGPIFHEVMMAAVENLARRDHAGHITSAASVAPIDASQPIVPPTSNVHRVRVCAVSGLAAGAACPVRATEWMPTDAPLAECTWHHASDEGLVTVWPEVYRDWARSAGLLPSASSPPSLLTRPSAMAAHLVSTSSSPLAIVTPLAGAVYLLDPTLRREFQALPLRATGGAPGARQWFVDGAPLGSEHDDAPLQWPLTNGAHAFTVQDTVGKRVSTTVIVR